MSGGYGGPYGGPYGGLPPEAEGHVDAALDRLLEQYKDQPNIAKVVAIAVRRWQYLENLLVDLLTLGHLDVAEGWLLDVYGLIVDLARRPGWLDDDYRFFIRCKIAALKSSGTRAQLIALAELMRPTSSMGAITFTPEYPKGWRLTIPDVPAALQGLAAELFEIATAAGERGWIVFYSTTSGAPFTFAKAPGSTYGWHAGVFAHSIAIIGTGGP